MNPEHRKTVTAELLALYGDALNLRGLVCVPSDKEQYDGKVSFNVIDSGHSDFGRHVWYYSIDRGKVCFFRDNSNRKRSER